MVEVKPKEDLDKEVNDELRNLIVLMSGLNIEHKKTLNRCYAEHFAQKVHEFNQIEKQIQLLVNAFATKAKDFKDKQIYAHVYKYREESMLMIKDCFSCIKMEGFGMDRKFKCQKERNKQQATKEVVDKPSSGRSNDNFCEFILKDDKSDKPIKIIGGYGEVALKPSSTKNVSDPKKKPDQSPKIAREAIGHCHSDKIEVAAMDASPIENTEPPTSSIEMAVQPGGSGEPLIEMAVVPIEVDEVDSHQAIHNSRNSNVPIRLRFKRNLSSLMPKNETTTTTDPDEVESKRKR